MTAMFRLHAQLSLLALALLASACGGTTAAAPPPSTESHSGPPPPSGPTRTDFKTIAGKLVSRCVAGGWISEWRSKHEDPEVARPKIFLRDFEDQTKQDLDPTFLSKELERRMRLSRVFEMVSEEGDYDFIGRGKLLRLAERTRQGRVSVYTAVLELLDPDSQKVVYSCEATVEGDL